MTLDDQLRRTMASFTDRVREEAERQLAVLTAEFSETITSERAAAAAQASAETRAAAERDLAEQLAAAEARLSAAREACRAEGYAAGKAEGERCGRTEGRREGFEEGLEEGRVAANERLLDAIRAIDAAGSLTEALDALASSARREAARVAVLLVEGGTLRGWRFIGFGGPLDERRDVLVPSTDAGVIAEAVRTGIAVSADSATADAPPAFAELPPGREVLAVPVQMRGQVIAVLYADQGAERTSTNISWPATLEVLARHAARALECITVFRAAQLVQR